MLTTGLWDASRVIAGGAYELAHTDGMGLDVAIEAGIRRPQLPRWPASAAASATSGVHGAPGELPRSTGAYDVFADATANEALNVVITPY